ncbi:MAG: redoxin family protein [Planctomycetota bacterium]
MMTNTSDGRSWVRWLGCGLIAGSAVATMVAGGCSGGSEPKTADKSRYQVAGDDTAEGGADPAKANNGLPSDDDGSRQSPIVAGKSPKPPTTPPGAGAGDPGETGEPAGGANPLPEGSPDEMLAFLRKMEQNGPPGKDDRERMRNAPQWMEDQLTVIDRLLASDADEKQRALVARGKRDLLIQMTQMRMPGMEKKMTAFCDELVKDKSPALVRIGTMTQLQLTLAKLASGGAVEPDEISEKLNQLLADPNKDDELFDMTVQAAGMLQASQMQKEALGAFQAIGEAFKGTKSERINAMLPQLTELTSLYELEIDAKFEAVLAPDAKPEAAEALMAAATQALDGKPGRLTLEKLLDIARNLEYQRREDLADPLFAALAKAYPADKEGGEGEQLAKTIELRQRRAKLIGSPLAITGKTLEGEEFDWKKYEGKIVLVDFWATWCRPCLVEIPNIKRNYDRYHEKGFEVVAINLDRDKALVDRFFANQTLPWANVLGSDLSEQCGVESIPFVLLVGRDGRVTDLHVRGPALGAKLAELFGVEPGEPDDAAAPPGKKAPAKDETPQESKKEAKEAADKPADKPAAKAAKKDDEQTAARQQASLQAFLALADDAVVPKPDVKRGGKRGGTATAGRSSAGDPTAKDPTAKAPAVKDSTSKDSATRDSSTKDPTAKAPATEDEKQIPAGNPYAPGASLTTRQLADFILKMQEKPKTIQGRTGFADAIVIAADRILSATDADEKTKLVATQAKLETLHKQAAEGNPEADAKLALVVKELQNDERPSVARQIKFLQLERQVIEADNAPLDQVPAVLATVKEYCEQNKLDERHVRLASSTVRVINRLEDGDQREKHFAELGGLFAKSSDKELARYGRKLAKSPDQKESDLVGKPLEIAGNTVEGQPLKWEAYRGKVVIVDFWATWCGPCIRELPNVKAMYEKHHQKGFDIVGISLDADLGALTDFLEKNPLPWTTLAGEGTQELATKYGVRGIPTLMLVDREGKVVAVSHRIEELSAKMEKLLETK